MKASSSDIRQKSYRDSGYMSSPNTANDSQCSSSLFSFDDDQKSFTLVARQICDIDDGNSSSSINLNMNEGEIMCRRRRRRHRTESDPFPCSAKVRDSMDSKESVPVFHIPTYSSQAAQTCCYCSFICNSPCPCHICHGIDRASNFVRERPVAVVAPFAQSVPLLSTESALTPSDVPIDNIAHRLRAIADDLDQRHRDDAENDGFVMGLIRDLYAAVVGLLFGR